VGYVAWHKGTMSEAELPILRSRLDQGRLHKARRGEVSDHAPIGSARLPTGAFALDPDEQVPGVVRLLFAAFDRQGTVRGLLRYLVRHAIRVPVRPRGGPHRGAPEWRRPNRVSLHHLPRHPIGAGFYRWGPRAPDPRRHVAGRPGTGRTVRPPEDCLVLLEGRCPAYLPAARCWANQRRLAANRARAAGLGAVRQGPSLLGGLRVCGRGGRRLLAQYTSAGKGLRYSGSRGVAGAAEPPCRSRSGRRLDALVSRQVLTALAPAALEWHRAAAADVEQGRQRLHRHRQRQRQRARYQAERAARQYPAVEPENRLVARESERRWEEALAARRRPDEDDERCRATQPPTVSAAERGPIRSRARDPPELWPAGTTTPADRPRLVRSLIERIRVGVRGETDQVDVAIPWAGGSVSRHTLTRAVRCYGPLADYPRLGTRLAAPRARGRSLAEVAEGLNREGFHPPKRPPRFSSAMVAGFLAKGGRRGPRPRAVAAAGLLRKGAWLLSDWARALGMPAATLQSWRQLGRVRARKLPVAGGHWAIWAAGSARQRLTRLRPYRRPRRDQPIPAERKTPQAPTGR
jgi:hypothetical protein